MSGGDPVRFLDWVRDAAQAPLDPATDETAWTRLVHDAFAYAERGCRRSVSSADSARLACAAGCAWCCHLPVITTAAEVRVAWRYAQAQLPRAALDAVRERSMRDSGGGACPFLIDDRCSVYPARPLACRAWNSTDAVACERACRPGEAAPAIPVLSVVRGVFTNAAQALAGGIVERGGDAGIALCSELARLASEHADAG